MKKIKDVDRLETHDRLQHIKKEESPDVAQGIRDCIANNPFKHHADYVYIFAHRRSGEFGEPDRLIWQPRLTKPKSQTNSMCFKIYMHAPDDVHIKWILPPREQWNAYEKGMMFENEIVINSIDAFENDRQKLDHKEQDDLDDWRIEEIYREISKEAKKKKPSLMQSFSGGNVAL